MPRPRKMRSCRRYRADRIYKPHGVPLRHLETVDISLDQFEVLRLCDVERLDQADAGERMGISRGTVQRLLYEARQKMVEAILHQRAIAVRLRESEDCRVGLYPHHRRCRKRRHGL